MRIHSGINSACEHIVVILVCAHSDNTSVCAQWYY